MLMESLRTRMGGPGTGRREAWAERSLGPMSGQFEDRRGELPAALDLLPALRGSRFLLVAVKDRDGRYLEANEPYARALGLSTEAIRGRRDRDLFAPDVAGEMAKRERLALRGVTLKPELEWFGGEVPAYLVERLPILDAKGHLRAVCVIAMEAPSVPLPEVVTAPVTAIAISEPKPPAAEPWLSFGAASTHLEWDAALYRSLLARFCQRYQGFALQLPDRFVDGPKGELSQDLGRLASGARNLGALPLAEFVDELLLVLQRDGAEALTGRLAELTRKLDATLCAMENRSESTAEPLDWPSAVETTATPPDSSRMIFSAA